LLGLTLTIHALTFGTSRFRLPLIPLLAIPAAAALLPAEAGDSAHRIWLRRGALAVGWLLLAAAFAARWSVVFDVF
jgi:hypothetical protein